MNDTSSFLASSDLSLATPVPLTAHPAAVYLDSLSPGSKRTMRPALDAIARLLTDGECDALSLDWSKLRYQHAAAIRTALKNQFSPATANKMLCALRRVLKEALKLDLIEVQDYAKAVDFPSFQVSKKLRGRALNTDEIAALMKACLQDPTPVGVRDAALIAVLRGAGLRRAEVASLELRDFNARTGAIEVRGGKGNKDRLVYLPDTAVHLVEKWLKVRGKSAGALLHPIRRGGRLERKHLTPQAIYAIVRRRASEAGVEHFSPHDFRRTFCSDLLDAGTDIVTVQQLAGHSSPLTTAKYDRRGEETKRKAVQKLEIPVSKR